jgi:L,D-transpeptidase catalytic domain
MLRRVWANLAVAGCLIAAPVAHDRAVGAEVVISVNKATQTMSVLVDGVETHNWVVSTGVGGGPYDGTYKPGRMERKWASRKYNMAPMPYSIFFDGNYAIHGTVKVSQLGRRASKGCVRLHPKDAAVLFALVGREKSSTTIVIAKTTHVAARSTPVKSDAPAVEAKAEPAQVETPAAEQPRPQLAKADAIIRDESAVSQIRKRASRKASSRAERPLSFGMKYGAAQ